MEFLGKEERIVFAQLREVLIYLVVLVFVSVCLLKELHYLQHRHHLFVFLLHLLLHLPAFPLGVLQSLLHKDNLILEYVLFIDDILVLLVLVLAQLRQTQCFVPEPGHRIL